MSSILDDSIQRTLQHLTTKPKGIFAADESIASVGKKFQKHHIENTANNRLDYRTMLLTTPQLSDHISGVILFDETTKQYIEDQTIPHYLESHNIVPGIKVDLGLKIVNDYNEEETQGLDDLLDRAKDYYEKGLRFAKWRAVYHIDVKKNLPSAEIIQSNAKHLARYAEICLKAGLVPMVEPEVLSNGDHDIHTCYAVTAKVLKAVFHELEALNIDVSHIILKPNMIVPGLDHKQPMNHEEVAHLTYRCLFDHVPHTIGAIMFLSGGQSDEDVTKNLNAIAKQNKLPWRISFSFGRALQDQALAVWGGIPDHIHAGQHCVAHHALQNGKASIGCLEGNV